jgi:hypothetical protein
VKRLRTAALLATVVAVALLVVSLVTGLGGGAPEPGPQADVGPGMREAPAQGRVEVLNAAGRPGLARAGTWVLRERGYDVVSFGNAQGFPPDSSLVIARSGDLDLARRVAMAMRIASVRELPDASLMLDVTVVLGRDWDADEVPLPFRPAPLEP